MFVFSNACVLEVLVLGWDGLALESGMVDSCQLPLAAY